MHRAGGGGDDVGGLSGHGWYHGTLPRADAEALVRRDGEYLVRDSSTQSGCYVLTLRWAGLPLHFVINRRPSSDVSSHLLAATERATEIARLDIVYRTALAEVDNDRRPTDWRNLACY